MALLVKRVLLVISAVCSACRRVSWVVAKEVGFMEGGILCVYGVCRGGGIGCVCVCVGVELESIQ